MASSKQTQTVSTNAHCSKRMSTPGSSASAAAPGSTTASASTTPGVNPDKAMARLLYAMLKQKSLKDVASDPVLLEGISNGHAARMRYSRFRNAVENSKPSKRQPKSSASASTLDKKASCNRVTKRKSAGARKVADDDEHHHRDADGDTEDDDDDDDDDYAGKGKGKENRHQPCKTARTLKMERDVAATKYKHLELGTPRAAKIPKEDPDVMDPQVSFSSLPSPPMESENTMDFADESPLFGQEPLIPSAAPTGLTRDKLLVLKKRKAVLHSPTMDMETTLYQISQMPQAPVQSQVQAQAQSQMRHDLDMAAGFGLSSGASRIHSMPLLHTSQHRQDVSHMSGYDGGAMMMRHHSAGSVSGLAGADISQAHQSHQAHHIVSSNGSLLGHARTRLLTPSSDDYHQQQQQQQQQPHSFLHQKHIPSLHVDSFLAFGTPIKNPSISDAATPHTQWTTTTTPFASPHLGETLDSTLDNTIDMSPYMAPGMDFGAVGDGSSMDPIMNPIDPSTSLFALVDESQQQPPSGEQQYMAHAFAKHSNGWDAMISQDPHM